MTIHGHGHRHMGNYIREHTRLLIQQRANVLLVSVDVIYIMITCALKPVEHLATD